MTGCTATPQASTIQPVETIVLLHGLGRTARSMAVLQSHLEQHGYRVKNWEYQSLQQPIEVHGARLRVTLAEMDDNPQVSKIHLVTHSLGGIITRYALHEHVPKKMGRVVMLAPPNRGSRLARRTAPMLGRVMKSLNQLSDHPDSTVNQLPVPAGVEIGIIAAAYDGKVRVEDTHLLGEADHLVVPGFHTFIMNRRDVHEQVVAFIRNGWFNKDISEHSCVIRSVEYALANR